MNADLARKRAHQQNSRTHRVRLDPSWETNPDSTTLLCSCQTCDSLSPPPPWLEQTTEKCVAGKPTDHTGKQELDRSWSGTGLESPFSDSALPCQPQLTETETQRETERETERDRERQRETERDREREKEKERERERQRKKRKEKEREGKRKRRWIERKRQTPGTTGDESHNRSKS